MISGTFGAVHCVAWNFFFATYAECVAWKVGSVLTVVLPMCCVLFPGRRKFLWPLLLLYVPVRLYLMIEPFAAFRAVPVGIFYTIYWSTWIPHV
jgi:hypothetical protein